LEESLLIVTADHGYSFRIGASSRRLLGERNVEEIAPVPMFVKAPGQMEGDVNRSLARNIDLVATIADLLETDLSWKQDGHSVLSEEVRRRKLLTLPTRDFEQVIRIGIPELERRRARWRRRWARLFGTGAESVLLYGDPWARAYRIGPNRKLLDRRVATLRVRPTRSVTASVANARLFEQVARGAKYFPTRVTGPLRGVPGEDHRDLALAVNGRIRAVGRSFDLRNKRREFFSFVLPESVLRTGANRLELFEVRPGGSLVRLYGTL
jgi:hypothetical protein